MGNRNTPFYRVVAADARTPTDGRFIENLGWYDPDRTGANFALNVERVQYWAAQGAQLSDTVRSLLKRAENAPQPQPEAEAPAPEPAAAAETVVETPEQAPEGEA
jgi:small subunit ribosomal protein S16